MKGRLLVAAILGVALAARLGLALLYEPPPPRGDAADFAAHAAAIVDEGGYPPARVSLEGGPSAFRPPGYPYALAAVYAVSGRGDSPRAFGAVLGTLAVALLGLIALRLLGRRTALVAMAIAAVFPPLVMVSVAQLSEALFIVLVLGAVACVVRDPGRLAWVIPAGALVGAAALTRTNGLVLLLPLLLAARGRVPRLALLAAALAVMTPWAVRNTTAFDSFVPTTTQTGFAFAGAYNDEARNDDDHPAAWRIPDMPPYIDLPRDRDEAEIEAAFRREALAYAGDHPTYPLVVLFWATARMLNLADPVRERASAREAGVGGRYVALNRYSFWLLALVAVAGARTTAVRAAPRWLWLVPALLWLSVAVTIGFTRYRTPIDPFLVLLAAAALAGAAGKARDA